MVVIYALTTGFLKGEKNFGEAIKFKKEAILPEI
jgi:hypothetical protein